MEICTRQKVLHHYQFSNLSPKLCENCSFPQNFHTRKLGEITVFLQCKELSYLITVIAPCSDSPRHHQKNFLMRFSIVIAVNFVQLVVGRIALVFITVYSFMIIKQKFYNWNMQKYFKYLFLMYILGILFSNCNLALTRLHFHVYSYFMPNQNE